MIFGLAARREASAAIADRLNRDGFVRRNGKPWTQRQVAAVLANGRRRRHLRSRTRGRGRVSIAAVYCGTATFTAGMTGSCCSWSRMDCSRSHHRTGRGHGDSVL